MGKNTEVISVEKEIFQKLKPYFRAGFSDEAVKLLEGETEIYIFIDGHVVMLKHMLPEIEINYVMSAKNTELAEGVLKKSAENNAFFKAASNNMMQKLL
jgi:hypothetical protein